MQEFNQSGNEQKVLPTAVFLIGYVIGPLVFSPLSETVGRRPVLLWSFTVFVLATLACAFAPNWPALLVFRLICGLMGAAPQTVIGGLYADLFSDIRTRGRAMAMYMSVCEILLPDFTRVLTSYRLQVSVQFLVLSFRVAHSNMDGDGRSEFI